MGHIVVETIIDAPREVCFDAALDVGVHTESAAFSKERLVRPGKLEGRLEVGDLVCFEGRHFGVRQRFCARITEAVRPDRFTDEMVEGIFTTLRHVHEFESREGKTVMRDTLDWTAPLGILGRLADRLFLESHMRWFVATKQRHLKEIVER
jgi:ligand-binding SRPBCC domain-containing protein